MQAEVVRREQERIAFEVNNVLEKLGVRCALPLDQHNVLPHPRLKTFTLWTPATRLASHDTSTTSPVGSSFGWLPRSRSRSHCTVAWLAILLARLL